VTLPPEGSPGQQGPDVPPRALDALGRDQTIDVEPNVVGVCEEEALAASASRPVSVAFTTEPVTVSTPGALILCVVLRALIRTIVRVSGHQPRLDMTVRLWAGEDGAAELFVGTDGGDGTGEGGEWVATSSPDVQPDVIWIRRDARGDTAWRVTYLEKPPPR
jgi:hypothetical protein